MYDIKIGIKVIVYVNANISAMCDGVKVFYYNWLN